MNMEVGSNEAKTKLPELLHGEAVASLVPPQDNKHSDAAAAADAMLAFMMARKPVSTVDIKALINEERA